MKKGINNYNLVQMVIEDSDLKLNDSFKKSLENKLLKKRNNLNLFNIFMSKNISIGFVVLLVLFGLGYGVYSFSSVNSKTVKYDAVVGQIKKDNNGDAAVGMKIAVDDHNSLSSAITALSFVPFKPTQTLGYMLALVQTGRTFDGSKSDLLMLGFSDDSEEVIRVTNMKTEQDLGGIDESEQITLKVEGKEVKGYYIKYDLNDIDPNSELALGGELRSATQVINFTLDGVNVDVSTYSDQVTKADLIKVANSVVR